MSLSIVLSATAYAPRSHGLLDPDWLRPEALVLAIDLKAAWKFDKAGRFALKVTDDATHADDMLRDGVLPDVGGFDTDVLALLAGHPAPWTSAAGPTLFMPPGHAAADHAGATYFMRRLGAIAVREARVPEMDCPASSG